MTKATDQISTSPPKDPAPADDCPVLHLALEYDRLAARMRSEQEDPDGDAIFNRLHAISEEARAFYTALGFDPSPLEPMTLLVTLADLKAAL